MSKIALKFAGHVGLFFLAFTIAFSASLFLYFATVSTPPRILTDGEIMQRFLFLPALAAGVMLALFSLRPSQATVLTPVGATQSSPEPGNRFQAQVVGVQWLNPLQRRDYPTEWQLLWTLGLASHNKDDDMVRKNPAKYSRLQAIGSIANGNKGRETFAGYHQKYVEATINLFHSMYYTNSTYFYNVASNTDKTTWRELAGIRVEYALQSGRLDPVEAGKFLRKTIVHTFSIGFESAPSTWSRKTPPDVRVTSGGPNAGFLSLSAALAYLEAHRTETVWVMNWDAPSFPPNDEQINENMVLLVLAGPDFKTDRNALAWLSYPATKKVDEFEAKKGMPSRIVQAWTATLATAATNAGKDESDVGYVIHDANNVHPASSERIASLAQTLTTELVEFDFMKRSFNTPALLGDMGAGTALTNVALGIAYANRMGKHVLIAGTTDASQTTAVVVSPPAKVRPLDPSVPWFRARGMNTVFLPWWGIRHDAQPQSQGYSR